MPGPGPGPPFALPAALSLGTAHGGAPRPAGASGGAARRPRGPVRGEGQGRAGLPPAGLPWRGVGSGRPRAPEFAGPLTGEQPGVPRLPARLRAPGSDPARRWAKTAGVIPPPPPPLPPQIAPWEGMEGRPQPPEKQAWSSGTSHLPTADHRSQVRGGDGVRSIDCLVSHPYGQGCLCLLCGKMVGGGRRSRSFRSRATRLAGQGARLGSQVQPTNS